MSNDTRTRSSNDSRHLRLALLINAGFWMACLAWLMRGPIADPGGVGAFVVLVVVGFAMVTTTVGVVVIHFVAARFGLKPYLRVLAYALPTVAMVVLYVALPNPPPRPNQTRNLQSPSGSYVFDVPIRYDRWTVTIRDAAGKVEYTDTDSDFVGWLNVYWVWDSDDRAWLYNSDDGAVYYWEKAGGQWKKAKWHGETHEKDALGRQPPPAVFKDYD